MSTGIQRKATFSNCGLHRYWLERQWAETGIGFVNYIMLNPSTADAHEDDPTIQKCMGFARMWGYDGIHVVNLFSFRATNPKALAASKNPGGGDENDAYIKAGILSGEITIVGWGANKIAAMRAAQVMRMLDPKRTYALRINDDGTPGHPLYIPYTAKRIPFPQPQDQSADGLQKETA